MRTLTPLSSTAQALHRVFVASVESHPHLRLFPSLLCSSHPLRQQTPHHHRSSPSRLHIRHYARPSSHPTSRRLPRDEEIQSPLIQLVNDDCKLDPPAARSAILSSINRTTHFLVQVQPPSPSSAASTDEDSPAVCKVMGKLAMRDAERARAKSARNTLQSIKHLELNWAIDSNDLDHRLGKLQDFLEKGMRVEMVLAAKRKGRKATAEEAVSLLRRIRERVAQVHGAKETRDMDGKVLGLATLFFDGAGAKAKS